MNNPVEAHIIEIAIWWIAGLMFVLFLLFFGGIAAEASREFIRNRYIKRESISDSELKVFKNFFEKPGLKVEIGYIERLFFTICVAFDLSGVVIAIIGWVTLKMFYIWAPAFETLKEQKAGQEKEKTIRLFSEFAMSSVLASIVSITFALIAGLFCQYGLPLGK